MSLQWGVSRIPIVPAPESKSLIISYPLNNYPHTQAALDASEAAHAAGKKSHDEVALAMRQVMHIHHHCHMVVMSWHGLVDVGPCPRIRAFESDIVI